MSGFEPEADCWPGVEVAIEGTNLSPRDIPSRQLIELLEATTATLDAIAAESGVKSPAVRLVQVRPGSAAYDLRVPEVAAVPLFDALWHHVETRGSESSPAVRRALGRLHRAGKTGSVRLRIFDGLGHERGAPLYVAPPLEVAQPPVETTTELQARVVGVAAGRGDRLSVRLRLDDGGTVEFEANQELARAAARAFLRAVRVEVDYGVSPEGEVPGQLAAIEMVEFVQDEEILDELERVSGAVALNVRASDWLKELDE
jgi:hypothetical protein